MEEKFSGGNLLRSEGGVGLEGYEQFVAYRLIPSPPFKPHYTIAYRLNHIKP